MGVTGHVYALKGTVTYAGKPLGKGHANLSIINNDMFFVLNPDGIFFARLPSLLVIRFSK